MENLEIIGIYKITSPTGKVNIGQSTNIYKRWQSYKGLYSSTVKQPRLYNSLTKYTPEAHIFEVIEECSVGILNERERFWQDYYEVLGPKGLNCRVTGTEDKSGYVSDETKQKQSVIRKGRRLSEEHKEKLKRPQSEETKEKRRHPTTESHKTSCKLAWERKTEEEKTEKVKKLNEDFKNMSEEKRNIMIEISKRNGKANKGQGKTIEQLDFDGNIIKNATINIFMEDGYNKDCIYLCCSGRNKSHGNYKWRFEVLEI